MQGWISIHRQLKDHWLWKEKTFTKGQAWIDILMRVNHKENKVPVGNEIVEIKKGQTLWSIKDMAEHWGWSRKKVDNFLNVLEKEQMLSQKRTSKYTLVTIENWELYQTQEHQKNNKRASDEHQKNTNNNVNNDLIKDIVVYLNEKTNKKYKSSSNKTIACITARINEGFTLVDFKKVIDVKFNEWIDNEEMEKFLRPETLFGNKFEGYLNQESERKVVDEYANYGNEQY